MNAVDRGHTLPIGFRNQVAPNSLLGKRQSFAEEDSMASEKLLRCDLGDQPTLDDALKPSLFDGFQVTNMQPFRCAFCGTFGPLFERDSPDFKCNCTARNRECSSE